MEWERRVLVHYRLHQMSVTTDSTFVATSLSRKLRPSNFDRAVSEVSGGSGERELVLDPGSTVAGRRCP